MKNMKMFSVLLLVGIFSLSIISLSSFVQAPTPFRGFIVSFPDIVEVVPGNTTTVTGGITNIGFYWEHNVIVNVTGLPSEYNVTPSPDYFEDLRTIREWTPEKGVYKVPVPLNVTIATPSNAVPGLYTVNVTLVDTQSARMTTNYTVFILRITGEVPKPNLEITNILVPERVTEFKPFNISFSVKNNAANNQSITLALIPSENWTYEPSEISDVVTPNSSKAYYFSIIPTNVSGSFSIVLKYPFQNVILNVTKSGPFLAVVSEVGLPTGGISLPSFPPISGSALNQLASFASANPLITVVIVVVVAVLLYYIYTSYVASSSRRKPEEMKRQTELSQMKNKITTVDTSEDSAAVSNA